MKAFAAFGMVVGVGMLLAAATVGRTHTHFRPNLTPISK